MTDLAPTPRPDSRSPARGRSRWFDRVDPLTSLYLVLPLFVFYQLGILTQVHCDSNQCQWVENGADFLTASVMSLAGGSLLAYAAIMVGVAGGLWIAIVWARRRARLHPRMFVPVLFESAAYATLLGPLVVGLEHAMGLGASGASGPFGNVIASCGAGLHEELVFRVGLFAGGAVLLRRAGVSSLRSALVAGAVSSVLFALAHHVGPFGERFSVHALVFRTLAGVVFAVIYRTRGFAHAAWTHALYDVWVFAIT